LDPGEEIAPKNLRKFREKGKKPANLVHPNGKTLWAPLKGEKEKPFPKRGPKEKGKGGKKKGPKNREKAPKKGPL